MFVLFLLLSMILLSVCWFNILLLLCDNTCITLFRLHGARNLSLERKKKEIGQRLFLFAFINSGNVVRVLRFTGAANYEANSRKLFSFVRQKQ